MIELKWIRIYAGRYLCHYNGYRIRINRKTNRSWEIFIFDESIAHQTSYVDNDVRVSLREAKKYSQRWLENKCK